MAKNKAKALTAPEIADIRKILNAKKRLLARLHPDGTEKPETEEEKQASKIDELHEYYREVKIAEKAASEAKEFVALRLNRGYPNLNKSCLNLTEPQFEKLQGKITNWLKDWIFPFAHRFRK